MHNKRRFGNIIIKKINTERKKKGKKKVIQTWKKKHYTPLFQTIYLFHFLFILSDLKSYQCENLKL
jgi:hypothetical protein